MKSKDQGRSKTKKSFRSKVALASVTFFYGMTAFASLTVREIQVKGNQIEIQLDGVSPKGAVDLDYVRDIVQFSIPNATIYPAKILHADNQSFSKVFAYQYAPNLVRVRFSVDGRADSFKGKVKWQQKGKLLTVSFPNIDSVDVAKKDDSDAQEKSLLAKVLSSAKKEDVKVEEIKNSEINKPEAKEVKAEAKVEAKTEAKAETKTSKKLTGNGEENRSHKSLGGQSSGPSAFRSFLAMFLVVGGLGLVLVYVKKKKNSVQARKVGDSWLSNLIPGSMKKQKSFIEVIAQHSLGPKHSIQVVKIKGQQFVLAVTPENLQLITQLDSDDAELDLLEDPAVAASIGKIFGSKPAVQAVPVVEPSAAKKSASVGGGNAYTSVNTGSSFDTLLKNSNGAGAIVARNAYNAQGATPAPSTNSRGLTQQVPVIQAQQNSVRDQIKRRLEGMKNA